MSLLPDLRTALVQAADEQCSASLVTAPKQVSDRAPADTRRASIRQRFKLHGRRLWAAIGASGTAIAGGTVAAVLLLSAGAPPAYAGWTATPTTPTASAMSLAAYRCNREDFHAPGYVANAFGGQPVLTESRGESTAIVSVTDGQVYKCLVSVRLALIDVAEMGAVHAAPGPDQLAVPYQQGTNGGGEGVPASLQRALRRARESGRSTSAILRAWIESGRIGTQIRTGGYGDWVLGQAGSGVTAVTFTFANRGTVAATVEHGWYFAWWPWHTYPNAVDVTTDAGTTSSPMAVSRPGTPVAAAIAGCQPGTTGCVFEATATAAPTNTTGLTDQPAVAHR